MTTVIYRPDKETPSRNAPFTKWDGVKLSKGRNHLSEADFKTVSSHSDFERWVDLGAIEVIEGVEPEKEEETNNSLAGYSVPEAEKLILATFDLEQLKEWQSNESRSSKSRKTVLNAISNQIADVEGGKL